MLFYISYVISLLMRTFIFSLIILFSVSSLANTWTWKGFEIIGNHTISRDKLIREIPLEVGQTYQENQSEWAKWCEKIKVKYQFHYTECSAVKYVDFEAFFVIEVVETGYEHRISFRSNPQESVPLASEEILELYDLLYKRLWELFGQGVGVTEITNNGYLDFVDPKMHEIVKKLIKLVPPYKENLLLVLKKDKDVNKREKAANLLNWTLNNLPDTILKAANLLDDPSSLVRNNISRFTVHFVDHLKLQSDRYRLIDQFMIQLERPSHGDRNKSIYNLLDLAVKYPQDRAYIKNLGLDLIKYTSENSILSNVKEPAKDLLKLISKK